MFGVADIARERIEDASKVLNYRDDVAAKLQESPQGSQR